MLVQLQRSVVLGKFTEQLQNVVALIDFHVISRIVFAAVTGHFLGENGLHFAAPVTVSRRVG